MNAGKNAAAGRLAGPKKSGRARRRHATHAVEQRAAERSLSDMMERNTNYALVGLAAILLCVGLVVLVFWRARPSSGDFDQYDVIFTEPVRGLSVGGFVFFNGIRVGEVTDMKLDPVNPNKIVTRVRVDGNTPVRVDSRVRLEPQGITGVNLIQITAGSPRQPLLEPRRKNEVPTLRSTPSTFAGILKGGDTVLQTTLKSLDQVNRALSEENTRTFSRKLANVQRQTSEAAADFGGMGATHLAIANAQVSLEQARTSLQRVDRTIIQVSERVEDSQSWVDGDAKRAIAEASAAAAEIETASAELRSRVQSLSGPSAEFARTNLPQITTAAAGVEEVADRVQRLTEQIDQNPRGVLSRPPSRDREVPK